MRKLRCPECGLTVSVRSSGRGLGREPCPRCLARSGGLVSVWLDVSAPEPRAPSLEQRLRAVLHGGRVALRS